MKEFLFGLTVVLAAVSSVHADKVWYTWNGDGADDLWSNSNNWDVGTPGFQDFALFPGSTTQMAADINGASGSNMTMMKLWLSTAGYSIVDTAGGGLLTLKMWDDSEDDIRSIGAGVNEISAAVKLTSVSTPSDVVINVGTGNTLYFSGGLTNEAGSDTAPPSIQGGGTMIIGGSDDTSYFYNSRYTIGDASTTLLFNAIKSMRTGSGDLTQGTLGGTGGTLSNNTFSVNGSTISPGGDGTYGDEIESFTFSGTGNVNFNDGTSVAIQLDTEGNADQVILDLGTSRLTINSGVTLDLYGSSIPDGQYVIFDNYGTNDINGTFTAVNFNGSEADPSKLWLTYNGSDITLNVTGVPEPATLMIMAAGIPILLKHRRRRG